jgi:hypothetical protein
MFSKLKSFIIDMDYLFANVFLYSQSRAYEVLKDCVYAKVRRLNKEFNLENGSVNKSLSINEKELSIRNRSNSEFAQYSSGYTTEQIPREFVEIISNHRETIEKYLGSGFLCGKPLVFRNYNFDLKFRCYDIYSNIWHQDSHDGNRILKIFILLHHTSDEHGPFHYLNFKDVKSHWSILRNRWSFPNMKRLPIFEEQMKITGEAGDYVILDTSRCSHRASIPSDFRDMAAITLYPNWRKKNGRQPYV